ncbi:hypothetical protein AX766_00660 [Flavobacterium covae]|uniref:Lipocalin-like domain-containing protein n=2 Tax=Flavobacterium TaxID=237 RepID=A0AA94JMG6_9FLAO|nr:hypothetical protein AWN65_07635 [Flavobacterium covae]AND63034.1 hypothetical protein AX766_00660 [Flavobacterium covae]MCH4828590.1 hypothetical protein [Flavobacterium columnare]MCH4831842.1 hypothetical protein [Flavobacterium columnare]QYS90562.1 hypothetical protein JJC04_10865 [Flavobacterium covae]
MANVKNQNKMKKLVLMTAMLGVMISCKPKQSLVTTSVNRKTQVSLKGDWVVSGVEYAGSEYFKVTSFEIADAKCFEGSEWHLVSNNDSGNMTLNKVGCPSYASDIKWYVTDENQMVLKFIKEGEKPRKVTSGYILIVSNVTQNTFDLTNKVQVGNSAGKVVYHFRRK